MANLPLSSVARTSPAGTSLLTPRGAQATTPSASASASASASPPREGSRIAPVATASGPSGADAQGLMGQYLLKHGAINQLQLEYAIQKNAIEGGKLGRTLIAHGLASDQGAQAGAYLVGAKAQV